jgi:UDP-N-acetylglucosamine 1-carboxyvinyltransferase
MDRIVIIGGKPLHGSVRISGAKNATLPIMTACLLASGTTVLRNVPNLRDIKNMSGLLEVLGAKTSLQDHNLTINTENLSSCEAPYNLVKTMRASIYVLGPLLARFGKAKVSLPGGCAWGPRPVDLHLKGIKALGANIDLEEGYIIAKAPKLHGATIAFKTSSVGATGNIMMAAVLAKGTTVIENAACEPEIEALAKSLTKMGAHIDGIGTPRLEIEGVDALSPIEDTMIPDRIEAATFLVACGMAGGEITLEAVQPKHMEAVINKAKEAGLAIDEGEDTLNVQFQGRANPVSITTTPYPGFPTDVQAQWMALMCLAKGDSLITDTVFPDRFTHVGELLRLGASITMQGNTATVHGLETLKGAPVMSTDLRASASLILTGLAAKGKTQVSRVYHIDRGFERIEKKLQGLGAQIQREQDPAGSRSGSL